MTEVKLKQGFYAKNQMQTLNHNDIAKRKPFDLTAGNDDVVSFENKQIVIGATRTGSSFYNNGMNVLGPKVNKKFSTN